MRIGVEGCFFCNYTGRVCNSCGEAEDACTCPSSDQALVDCPECRAVEEIGVCDE